MSTSALTPALVYTREQFAQALGMSTRSFDRLRMEDPTFPREIRIAGPHDRPRWLRTQAEEWLRSKVAALEREEEGGALS